MDFHDEIKKIEKIIFKNFASSKICCNFATQNRGTREFPTRENSSVGRARPCQGRGRGFESRFSLAVKILIFAKIAQLVEHDLAKVGVAGSSPVFRSLECPGGGIGRRATLRG